MVGGAATARGSCGVGRPGDDGELQWVGRERGGVFTTSTTSQEEAEKAMIQVLNEAFKTPPTTSDGGGGPRRGEKFHKLKGEVHWLPASVVEEAASAVGAKVAEAKAPPKAAPAQSSSSGKPAASGGLGYVPGVGFRDGGGGGGRAAAAPGKSKIGGLEEVLTATRLQNKLAEAEKACETYHAAEVAGLKGFEKTFVRKLDLPPVKAERLMEEVCRLTGTTYKRGSFDPCPPKAAPAKSSSSGKPAPSGGLGYVPGVGFR